MAEGKTPGWLSYLREELRDFRSEFSTFREKQEEHSTHLQEYNTQLQLHIRGVRALEEQNKTNKQDFTDFKKEVDERLEVAERPILWAQTTGQIFKWVIGACAFAGGAYTLIDQLFG